MDNHRAHRSRDRRGGVRSVESETFPVIITQCVSWAGAAVSVECVCVRFTWVCVGICVCVRVWPVQREQASSMGVVAAVIAFYRYGEDEESGQTAAYWSTTIILGGPF